MDHQREKSVFMTMEIYQKLFGDDGPWWDPVWVKKENDTYLSGVVISKYAYSAWRMDKADWQIKMYSKDCKPGLAAGPTSGGSAHLAVSPGTATEQRIDPADGKPLTYEQMADKYNGTYKDCQIEAYWRFCKSTLTRILEETENQAPTEDDNYPASLF